MKENVITNFILNLLLLIIITISTTFSYLNYKHTLADYCQQAKHYCQDIEQEDCDYIKKCEWYKDMKNSP